MSGFFFVFRRLDQIDPFDNFRINFEGMRSITIYRVVFVLCTVVNVSKAEELSNEILIRFEKLLPKQNDFHVIQTMNILNSTLQRFNEFQRENGEIESRDAISNARIGIFVFTRYCGPGARFLNRIFNRDERTYASIDNCCRAHDDCPDFVSQPADYQNYPELDYRPQLFSRYEK